MAIVIPTEQFARLVAHAREGYPHEVVGILAGTRDTSAVYQNTVYQVVSLVNERADSPANRYQVSGLVLARAEQALEDAGHHILGYYHSHPDHPSQYSDFDRDHALPNMSYVIVSIRGGELANTQSWRLLDDRSAMLEETVTFKD